MKTFGDIIRKNKQVATDKQADQHRYKIDINRYKWILGKTKGRLRSEVLSSKDEGRSTKHEVGRRVRHWLLVALVFLLPLWFLPWGTDKVGLAKQLLMTIFVGVGFLLWIYESISSGKIVYRKSRINTGILILLLAFLLSTIFSLHPATSIYESSANFGNLWNFCLLALFYFLVVNDKRPLKNADINAEKTPINMGDMGGDNPSTSLRARGDKENIGHISHIRHIKLLDVFLVSTGLVVFYALLKILGINILGGFTKGIGFNTLGTMNSVAILAGLGLIACMGGRRDMRDKGDIREDMNGYKWIFVVIGILSFVFVILANFAPVWYGLILAMIIMIVFQTRKGGQIHVKTFSLPIALLAVSIVFALWGAFGVRIGLERPQLNLKNLPTEVYVSHKTSLDIANKTLNQSQNLKQSFFGVGLGNFNKSWLLHKPVDLNQTDFWQASFIQGFSSFTTLITETGYFGILAIIFFLVSVFKEIFSYLKGSKEKKTIYLAYRQAGDLRLCPSVASGEGGFTIYALAYLAVMWFFYSYNLTLYFGFFLVLGPIVRSVSLKGDLSLNDADINAEQTPSVNQRSNQRNIRVLSFAQPIKKALIFSLSLVFFAIVIVFAMYFEVRHYVSSANTAAGARQETIDINGLNQEDAIKKVRNELDAKINLLVNAYNLDKNNDAALRNISQYYINKINLTLQENKNLDISPLVQSAILAAKKATEINNTEYLNYLNLAQVYETFIALSGDAYGFAIDAYNKASELSPNDPSILFGIARSQFSEAIKTANSLNTIQDTKQKDELVKKQDQLLSDAIQNLNKAIALKINYTPAHQLLAQIYDAQGKIDEAIVSTTNLVILNQQDAGMWFQLGLLYYKKGDIDKAETAFGQAVVLKDDYSNARYFLGLVYSKKNKKTEAIDQFEKVAKLNPDNQEVKTILENLKAGRDALVGIVPPNTAPEKRTEVPIK